MNLNNFNIIKKTIFIIFSIMIIYQNRLDDKYILKISRKFNISNKYLYLFKPNFLSLYIG